MWRNDLLVVSHRPVDGTGIGFPGYVFVETRRHVPSLDELEPGEVGAIAQAVWWVARALRAEIDPQYVFSLVAGRSVAHFHQHVFVRHVGTPDDVGWTDGHLWAGAPRVTSDDIQQLCGRLQRHFPGP